MVGYLEGSEPETVSYALMDETGARVGEGAGPLLPRGAFVHGWHDQETVLFSYLAERFGPPGLFAQLPGRGEPREVPVRVDTGRVTRVWPVGDGSRIITLGERGMLRLDPEGAEEVRPLAEGCRVGLSDPGWSS